MSPYENKQHDAIEAAMELFWRKGYDETSMAEIVDATGMNRYALYSTFGNKRELFLAALARYFEEGRSVFEPMLTDTSVAPLDRVRTGMMTFIEMACSKQSGCFMCHVATNLQQNDEKISEAVSDYFDKILEIMQIPLSEAQERGDLNPNLSPAAAAKVVFNAELSIGIHARSGTNPEALTEIAEATLAALGAPPKTS